jgi:hypothetical protein
LLSNGPRDTDMLSVKSPGRSCAKFSCRGSAAVEAAVVIPIFMIALFSLAYIIKVFMAYNVMQSALQSVARSISNASYYYHISGLKDYSEKLDSMGQSASDELKNQADTIIGAVDSFSSLISNIDGQDTSVDLETRIRNIGALGKELAGDARDVIELVKGCIKDPKQEIKLLLTVFAQKAAYAARKEMVCLISRLMLEEELKKRATGMDVKRTLGIQDISFDQTQVFGDNESLEFIITYDINPPVPFGLVPKLALSNRVKVIGWTSGRGSSPRMEEQEDKPGDSVWVRMDTEKKYWDRGLAIEDLEVEKLSNEAKDMGMCFKATSKRYPVVDAFMFDDHTVKAFDLFTLNPFMKTYQDQPGRIKSEMKKHGKRLLEFEPQDYPEVWNLPNHERIIIIILPENAREALPNIEELLDEAKAELMRMGISEVRVRYDYGIYAKPEEDGGTGENGEDREEAA